MDGLDKLQALYKQSGEDAKGPAGPAMPARLAKADMDQEFNKDKAPHKKRKHKQRAEQRRVKILEEHDDDSPAGPAVAKRAAAAAATAVTAAAEDPPSFRSISGLSITSVYKQALRIDNGMLVAVAQKIKSNFVDLDVRLVQASAFMASINSQITDTHKLAFGPDLVSSWPHYLWVMLWGLLFGAGITLLIVLNIMRDVMNALTIAFYIFLALEYILMFMALKLGQYDPLPEMGTSVSEITVAAEGATAGVAAGGAAGGAPAETSHIHVTEEVVTQVPPGRVALIIPLGWGVKGLNDAQKDAKRDAKLGVLTNTITQALQAFHPTDIFVFHNSSDQVLPDTAVMECCSGRAIYVPLAIGSKSACAYYGSILSKWLGYQWCIVMDDDTMIPREMGKALSGELKCDAYCFAIAATSNDAGEDAARANRSSDLLIALQDIEYKLSDLSKLTQYNFTKTSSCLAPHGAINMWKTELLRDIMLAHNGIFHGEDYQMGLSLRMRFPQSRLGLISSCVVKTVAPSKLRDLYYQRFTSWDLASQQFLWGGFCASQKSAFYMQVMCCLPCRVDNMYLRIVTLEDVWTVLQDYLRLPLMGYHIVLSIILGEVNWVVLLMYLLVIGSQWVIAACLEYIKFKNKPHLQLPKRVRLGGVALFPIYRFAFSFVRVFSLLRFFFKFESIKRTAISIGSMNLPLPKRLPYLYPGLDDDKTAALGEGVCDVRRPQENAQVDPSVVKEIIEIALRENKKMYPRSQLFASMINNSMLERGMTTTMAKSGIADSAAVRGTLRGGRFTPNIVAHKPLGRAQLCPLNENPNISHASLVQNSYHVQRSVSFMRTPASAIAKTPGTRFSSTGVAEPMDRDRVAS